MKYFQLIYLLIAFSVENSTTYTIKNLIQDHRNLTIGIACFIGIGSVALFTISTDNNNKKNSNDTNKETKEDTIDQKSVKNNRKGDTTPPLSNTPFVQNIPTTEKTPRTNNVFEHSSTNTLFDHTNRSSLRNDKNNGREIGEKEETIITDSINTNPSFLAQEQINIPNNIEKQSSTINSYNNLPTVQEKEYRAEDNSKSFFSSEKVKTQEVENVLLKSDHESLQERKPSIEPSPKAIALKKNTPPSSKEPRNRNTEEEKNNREPREKSPSDDNNEKQQAPEKTTKNNNNKLLLSNKENQKIFIAYAQYTLHILKNENENEDKNIYVKPSTFINNYTFVGCVLKNNANQILVKNFYSTLSNRQVIIKTLYEDEKYIAKETMTEEDFQSWSTGISNYLQKNFTLKIKNTTCNESQILFLSKFIAHEIYSMKRSNTLYGQEINQITVYKQGYFIKKSMKKQKINFYGCFTCCSFLNLVTNNSDKAARAPIEILLPADIQQLILYWRKQVSEHCHFAVQDIDPYLVQFFITQNDIENEK